MASEELEKNEDDEVDTAPVDTDEADTAPTEPLNEDDIICHDEYKNADKTPLFNIEPKKEGCMRNDDTYLIAKKVGFFGLVICLILSIVFGAVNKIWQNSLNLLFMGLAIFMYGVQNMLELKATKHCNCSDCVAHRNKYKTIIAVCVVGFLIFLAIAIAKLYI